MRGKKLLLGLGAVLLGIQLSWADDITGPWPTVIMPDVGSNKWWLYSMDHGGVAEDVQLVYHDVYLGENPDPQDGVWAACMNGGYYRATWDETEWGDWQHYLFQKKGFGVDAIEVDGVEYVLGASQGLGVHYAEDQVWRRPNGDDYPGYPPANDWCHAGIHDAAFYWPEESEPDDPEGEYYLLATTPPGNLDPGIYRWTGVYPFFERVDLDLPNYPAHYYHHFYRDLNNPNVLYATSFDGAIYKLSGPYENPNFEKLPAGTKLQDLPITRPLLPAISNKR